MSGWSVVIIIILMMLVYNLIRQCIMNDRITAIAAMIFQLREQGIDIKEIESLVDCVIEKIEKE